MSVERLRFAPTILSRLGEELVPNPDLGVVELVRNSYDADANLCSVVLSDPGAVGGSIKISDDGAGMNITEIREGWLLLGQSQKTVNTVSPGGRRKIGEKGLGRLAALRLGDKATLVTYESGTPMPGPATQEHSLTLDWRAFDDAIAVEDVEITLSSRDCPPGAASGTVLLIEGLRHALTDQDVHRLARALVLLNGAFDSHNTFRAVLDSSEFVELSDLIAHGYFDQHEYVVNAALSTDGKASAVMTDWRGVEIARASHSKIASRSSSRSGSPGPYGCPPAGFDLWAYRLGATNFKIRKSKRTVGEVRAWLKHVGGVHLYHRGLRVHPYGDDGYDWLELNLRRVRSPEGRPGTNTSVGRVTIEDEQGLFVPKTDRSGFVENDVFYELKRFCGDILEWAADEQLRERDKDSKRKVTRARQQKTSARSSVDAELASLPQDTRKGVERAIVAYDAAVAVELELVVNELQLYRALSTVGTTTAVFAHETVRPLSVLEQMTEVIAKHIRIDLPDEVWYDDPIALMTASVSSLRTFAELPLRLLEAHKRETGVLDLAKRIDLLLDLFQYYFQQADVKLIRSLQAGATVRTSVSEIEAIVSNLIANAVHFLSEFPTSDGKEKTVLVQCSVREDDVVSLIVSDNGLGINGIDPDDVWLPGRTTREGGTGLGLTIVRDIVSDLFGRFDAKSHGRLGGAEFEIILPVSVQTEPEQLAWFDR